MKLNEAKTIVIIEHSYAQFKWIKDFLMIYIKNIDVNKNPITFPVQNIDSIISGIIQLHDKKICTRLIVARLLLLKLKSEINGPESPSIQKTTIELTSLEKQFANSNDEFKNVMGQLPAQPEKAIKMILDDFKNLYMDELEQVLDKGERITAIVNRSEQHSENLRQFRSNKPPAPNRFSGLFSSTDRQTPASETSPLLKSAAPNPPKQILSRNSHANSSLSLSQPSEFLVTIDPVQKNIIIKINEYEKFIALNNMLKNLLSVHLSREQNTLVINMDEYKANQNNINNYIPASLAGLSQAISLAVSNFEQGNQQQLIRSAMSHDNPSDQIDDDVANNQHSRWCCC